MSRVPGRILVVAPELAIDADGTYRPGGMALFARGVVRSLAGAVGLRRLDAWGLLDSPEGLSVFERDYSTSSTRVSARAFAGDRARMAKAFLLGHWLFDLVIFLHVGVGRLGILRGLRRQSLWLVGIEVRRPLRAYERFTVWRARPLLSISRYSSDEMRRHNPRLPGALPVHLGVEDEGPWSRSGGASEGAPYDAAARASAVVIVGRMAANERYKGHDQLIEAWPEVHRRHPAAELWIAGAGDDEARLRAKASLAGAAAPRIRFLGQVSHQQLLELYGAARVFAMPSTGEGFGLVFVEAMRWGLPCVCSLDSAAEIVVDGVTGLVVAQDPIAIAEACCRLLSDDALANRMGHAGQRRFRERYTFDGMRRRVRQAYGFDAGEASAPTRDGRGS